MASTDDDRTAAAAAVYAVGLEALGYRIGGKIPTWDDLLPHFEQCLRLWRAEPTPVRALSAALVAKMVLATAAGGPQGKPNPRFQERLNGLVEGLTEITNRMAA